MLNNLKAAKALFFAFFIFAVSVFFSDCFAQDDWNIQKSKHFIVYYQDIPSQYIYDLTNKAEDYYSKITDYLGYKGFDFWTWENRCKIYIYKNRQDYLDATGSIQWSRAHVNVKDRRIDSYYSQDIFYDTILPHELGHIIFRAFIGFDKMLPLCLDEGIACNQEKDYSTRLKFAAYLAKKDIYIPFAQLLSTGKKEIAKPAVFYSQCASLVDFLITDFGQKRFTVLCRRIRDGGDWEENLLKVYQFDDLEVFQKRWLESLNKIK